MAMGTCLPAKRWRRFGVALAICLLASQGHAGAGRAPEGAAKSADKDAKQEAKARFVSGQSHYNLNEFTPALVDFMNVLDSTGCSLPHRIYCFRSDGLVTDLVPPPQPGRRVFLSAKAFVPSASASPDRWCQSEATAANLTNASQFIAFISTSTTPALKRLNASGLPWKRADDVFVVRQISDFAGGKLLAPLGLFADGSQYSSANVWTGASDPSVVGSGTCQDWSTNSTTFQGLVGGSDTTAIPDWFDVAPTSCDSTTNHLICIEP